MRICHEFLSRVGDEGRYQYIIVGLTSLIFIHFAFSTFAITFLLYQHPYQCPSSLLNCQDYVCSLATNQRSQFITNKKSTLIDTFADYRCDEGRKIAQIELMVFSGGIIGVILGTILMRYSTHRRMLIYTMFVSVVGVTLIVIGWSLWVTAAGFHLVFLAAAIQKELIGSFVAQNTSDALRVKGLLAGYLAYAFGVGIISMVFLVFASWFVAVLAFQLIPAIIYLCVLVFYIKQAPIDLLRYGTPQQSLAVFEHIASINGLTCDLTLEQLEVVHRQYAHGDSSDRKKSFSMLDLFSFKSLRCLTILMIFLRLAMSYQFHAPVLYLGHFGNSIYLNGLITSAGQITGSLLCFLVDSFPRRLLIVSCQVIGAAITLFVVITTKCLNPAQCSLTDRTIQTVGLFCFRILVTVTFNIFYLIKVQSFPSQIRAIALNLTSVAANCACLAIPLVEILFNQLHVSLMLSFGVACLVVIGLVLPLDETVGVPSPQLVEQLQARRQQDQH